MGLEYTDISVKFTEARPLSQLILGLVFMAMGSIYIWMFTSLGVNPYPTKSLEELFVSIFVSILVPILGFLLVITWIFYKPKIYDIYQDKIIVSQKSSGIVIEEIPMNQIKEIAKTFVYIRRRFSRVGLSSINYSFLNPPKSTVLRIGTDQENAKVLDSFIQNKLKIPMKVKEETRGPNY